MPHQWRRAGNDPEARPAPPPLAGALAWEGYGMEWAAVCSGPLDQLRDAAAAAGAEVVGQRVPSLDEIFVARVGTRCSEPGKE